MENVYRIVEGRLLEVRIVAEVLTPVDVDEWFNAVAAAMSQLAKGQRVVVAADWRRCPLMSSEAAERAAARLTQGNPGVERSAALADPASAVTVLQFLRLCRDTNPSGNRRLFTETSVMVDWLAECLTPAELARLRAFVDEPVLATARAR